MTPPIRDPRAGQDAPAAPRKIALVGLRASGKSSVGELLARQRGRPFVDLDEEIERLWLEDQEEPGARDPDSLERTLGEAMREPEPLPAGEILMILGEPAFRRIEAHALREVLARPEPLVLACGGGVVIDAENRRRLRQEAWVIWLQAPSIELARRLQADSTFRPSLTGSGMLEELATLGAQRQPWYEEVAHLAFRTEGLTPDQVARVVGSGLGSVGA